jgi:alkylresorcinol/alkylpyrone synthase
MTHSVRISRVVSGHPELRIGQEEAARRIGLAAGNERRAHLLARSTGIEERALALTPDAIERLGAIEERNDHYRRLVPELARGVASDALGATDPGRIGCLVTMSCTGYGLPSWGNRVAGELGFAGSTVRLPITEAGCSGGVLAMARAADYVRVSGKPALVVAAELCSLAFHPEGDDGLLTSALIFGDGLGAALLEPDEGDGLQLIASSSMLVPGTADLLGFDLTDGGFSPVLSRHLADVLPDATEAAVCELLRPHGIRPTDVAAWLLHPGGARILRGVAGALCLPEGALRWSWDSMREFGNTSSAAIFDVMRRYTDDAGAPRGWVVAVAFGPGVSLELLLLKNE